MARRRKKNLRYAVLAIVISLILWSIAHGSSSVERGYDIPVVFHDLPDTLVITDQSDREINIRVLGSRVALRNLSPSKMEYVVDVSGAKIGRTVHEVDVSRLDPPRGVRIVSRSPAQIDARFEARGHKTVRIRADLEGEPAEGFVLTSVELDPPRVRLTGARSRVLRLSEVVTETIDVSGVEAPVERQVKLSLGSDHVWMEDDEPVRVRIGIEPVEPPADEAAGSEGSKAQ
ncbi:MAG: YbbR-like domain-containing protein [Deltaproteobacteria bacterium]|nr:YbbR-like domain-containing protein [Deltaproteobacteria bacterium]